MYCSSAIRRLSLNHSKYMFNASKIKYGCWKETSVYKKEISDALPVCSHHLKKPEETTSTHTTYISNYLSNHLITKRNFNKHSVFSIISSKTFPLLHANQFHTSSVILKLKKEIIKNLEDKNKIEEFVEHHQKKIENRKKLEEKFKEAFIYKVEKSVPSKASVQPAIDKFVVKPSIMERVKHELKHYYNGFRLLYLDMKIAARLLWQVMNGKALSRRERKQFLRTVADMFRLVPFMVFLIIPFMEFLLPFAVKLFPGMLPSTFEDTKTKEDKARARLKLKLQMAEFLQDTIEEIAVNPKSNKENEKLKAFGDFVHRLRIEGETPSNAEIIKYSKLFEDEITLENLSHAQLKAICRLLMISPIGTSNFLRIKLDLKLYELKRDDQIIRREGIDKLNTEELQNASIARGMRSFGVSVDVLKSNLKQWLELSLDEDIPASLLLLSRTLFMSTGAQDQLAPELLKVTMSQFPERLIDEMEVRIGAVEREPVDRQTIIDIIQHEEEQIQEEKKKTEEEKQLTVEKDLSKEELLNVKETLSSEREELHKIKEDRNEYIEDLAEMKLVKKSSKENVASRRLGNRIDSMLSKIDDTLKDLEEGVSHLPPGKIDLDQDGIVTTNELFEAIQALRNAPDGSKTKRLIEALDEDKDGEMSLDELRRAVELLATEDLDLNSAQVCEVMSLLKGTENIMVIEQMLNKKKTNYILHLLPYVYGRKPIPAVFK